MFFIFISFLFLGARFFFSQEKEINLTLEDSILKALKNNLSIAVEVFNPEIAQASLSQAREVFMPRFDLNYGNQRTENPPYWWLQGAHTIVTKYFDYSASIVQQIPTGGNFSLSVSSYKSDTNQAFQLINPRYGSTLRLDFIQPILKDFGFRVNRRAIIVARNNVDISASQLKNTLLDTIYQVEEAYWNLVYAIENHKVKQRSLHLARDLLAKNKKEVELGQLAPLEILNAETAVAQREADILQAEAMVKRSEEILKALLNLQGEEKGESLRIIPVDRPSFEEREVSFEEALEEALARRPELAILKKTIETNELNLAVAKNQLLPALNFQLSYWSPGISGDRLLYLDDNPFLGIIIGKQKGSATDSLRDALKLLYNNWSLGLTLSLPLSNFLSRAEYARARLELEQSMARLKTLEQRITLEVSDAVREIETNAKRVKAYRLARELAERRLEAEMKKLNVGLSINYFVLEFQEELANAQSLELKALIDFKLSLEKLEKVTAKSLENRNIYLVKALSPC